MLFNGYDAITSSISGISVNFISRTESTASFSHLLTAVYKKDGKKKSFLKAARPGISANKGTLGW